VLADGASEVFDVTPVLGLAALGVASLPASARLRVGQRFLLRPVDGFRLRQDALSFVALARPRPLHNDRFEFGITARPARDRGIAGRQELQVVQVGADQAKGLLAFYAEQSPAP
jgi:hypothetical protein